MMTLMRLNCEPIIRIFQVSSKQIRANYATKPKKTLSKLFGSAALILRPRQPHTRNTGLYYSYNTSIFASGTSHSSINVRVPTEFNSFNYELCLIRRIDRDRNVAFPGGIVKDTDATLEWNSRIFHLSPAQLSALWTLNSRCRQYREYISSLASAPPAAPTPLEALEKSMLPPALSFRICFARELFEETGMLLLPDIVLTARAHASGVLSTSSLDSERAHVLREPAYFLELLARHTKDLRAGHSQSSSNDALESCGFGAHEWSEWTSPFMVKPQLNALFYAFLLPPELVPLTEQRMKPDNTEIDQIHWATPAEYLAMRIHTQETNAATQTKQPPKPPLNVPGFLSFNTKQQKSGADAPPAPATPPLSLSTLPPQLYELTRLCGPGPGAAPVASRSTVSDLRTLENVRAYIEAQRQQQLQANVMSFIQCDDGLIFALKGDERFEAGMQTLGTAGGTLEELTRADARQHRFVRRGDTILDAYCTVHTGYARPASLRPFRAVYSSSASASAL